MTTTVEIPDHVMKLAMLMTGAHSPEEVVLKAVEEITKPRDQKSLIPLLGTFEPLMTPEELDEMRSMD